MINNPYAHKTGTVLGTPPVISIANPLPKFEGHELKRAMNYYADFSGCGHWRMIWPEIILNGYKKCVIHGTTQVIPLAHYYKTMESVRIQRQVTPHQLEFVEQLCKYKDIIGKNFRIIYEIDDLIFPEDIPLYNKFRPAFTPPEIKASALEIIRICDEVTVTCDYMKEYFEHKTGHKHITVLKNYIPKFWMADLYDEKRIGIEYDKNVKKRKRPRVLWAGAGAHFNVGSSEEKDDFSHIINNIIKTRKKYKWIFFGGFPLVLKPYVTAGEMEYEPFTNIYDYPRTRASLNATVAIAPLCNNTFNKAKSDIKFIESGAFGTPVVCQDIETYSNALMKFSTGDEMIDQIDACIRDKQTYITLARKHRAITQARWLEDNIDEFAELYLYPYGDPRRVSLNNITI